MTVMIRLTLSENMIIFMLVTFSHDFPMSLDFQPLCNSNDYINDENVGQKYDWDCGIACLEMSVKWWKADLVDQVNAF